MAMDVTGEGDWAEVVAFLEGGGLGEPVERIDTHGAIVLLGRERAWKLKRAVRFDFMDFSTQAKREAAVRAELALNRRTAPELYRAVVPVTREAGGELGLGGTGEPAEWLLEMQRFPAEMQLDRLAGRGELTPRLLDALARAIAEFHDRAELRPQHGGSAAMRVVADGNAADLASLVPAVFQAEPVAVLARATAAELGRWADLLDRRRTAGAVRRCHGDLHLANIVLLNGRPVPFDCLEFSEELASIDVLYDLAFLVMDLLARGLRPEAWRLLQAYNERREEDEGLVLLPLFLSVRAAVRAKVAGFTAAAPGHAGDRDRLVGQGRAYLELARTALAPIPPVLIAIGGRSGTGKSTLAAALAPRIGATPGAIVLRSDVVRKRLLGREPTQRLPVDAYAPEITRQVHRRMAERAGTLLRAGRSVVCDAVYGDEVERWAVAGVAAGLEVLFRAFWLEVPEPALEARVAARTADASDADLAVVRRQRKLVRCATEGWRRVRADRSLDALVAELLAASEG
jgi:aminoglycoside phosphotransferase family enzyme/predicted kinase